jgi:hypothetical protein
VDRSVVLAVLVALGSTFTRVAHADDPPKSNAPKEAGGSGSGTNMIDEDRPDPIGNAWRKGAGPSARKPQTTAPAPAAKEGEESVHGDTPTATSQDEDGVLESYDKPRTKKDDEDDEHKAFALVFNPLGIFIGHYSVELQYLPIPHHALVLNPHFDHVSADVSQGTGTRRITYQQGFTGFGTELGYRFYTSGKGAAGFYAGASFLFGYYSTSVSGASSGASSPSVGFTTLGGAIDIGGQAIVGPGVIVGGGFGLQYTSASEDFSNLPLTAAILAGGGIRPRFLLSVGYAF